MPSPPPPPPPSPPSPPRRPDTKLTTQPTPPATGPSLPGLSLPVKSPGHSGRGGGRVTVMSLLDPEQFPAPYYHGRGGHGGYHHGYGGGGGGGGRSSPGPGRSSPGPGRSDSRNRGRNDDGHGYGHGHGHGRGGEPYGGDGYGSGGSSGGGGGGGGGLSVWELQQRYALDGGGGGSRDHGGGGGHSRRGGGRGGGDPYGRNEKRNHFAAGDKYQDKYHDQSPQGGGNGNGNGPPPRSKSRPASLLDEFRNSSSRNREWHLRDVLGNVLEFCQDQHGSRFIQQKLEVATEQEKETLFQEILPGAEELMVDVFGNYVVQKLLEHGTPAQRTKLAAILQGKVVHLALQMCVERERRCCRCSRPACCLLLPLRLQWLRLLLLIPTLLQIHNNPPRPPSLSGTGAEWCKRRSRCSSSLRCCLWCTSSRAR